MTWTGNQLWTGGADGRPQSSSGRVWHKPDLADLFAGALYESGASITVVSAYAFDENNVKATISSTGTDDGFREGYLARATNAKTLELLAALGTSQTAINEGDDIFEQWMIPRVYPNARGLIQCGLNDDDSFSAVDGGMAGYRGSTVAGEMLASVQDRTLDNAGDGAATLVNEPYHTRLQRTGSYFRNISQGLDAPGNLPVNFAYIRGAIALSSVLRLGLSLGTTATVGTNLIADYDIWYTVVSAEYDNGPS